MLDDHLLFFRQFRENFHSTGSVAPSSRHLARALARFVPHPPAAGAQNSASTAAEGPRRRRILEVGPGTGAVTRWIVPHLGTHDSFDLVEMNGEFVARLNHLFETHEAFQPAAGQARVLHHPVEELSAAEGYDAVVSGLPLNNFSGELVEHLLEVLVGLLAPGGTLSFFQYVGVRPAKLLVSRGDERARLQAIEGHLGRLLGQHEFYRECVLRNFPPAWVHHVRVTPSTVANG